MAGDEGTALSGLLWGVGGGYVRLGHMLAVVLAVGLHR